MHYVLNVTVTGDNFDHYSKAMWQSFMTMTAVSDVQGAVK